MEELGGEGREEGGGEGVGAPFNVLPPGATDLVAPLPVFLSGLTALVHWIQFMKDLSLSVRL